MPIEAVDRLQLEQQYKILGNQLPQYYPDLAFKNHCYWRIALDNTIQDRWDRHIDKPAYKNMSINQLKQVIYLLQTYKANAHLLNKHNQKSLHYRGKI